jgi:tRNA (guanosine-2'-O-)-methyltransferase
VIELLGAFVSEERRARIASVIERRLVSVTVALEHLHDPHNGAACMRSIEAFGLSALHVVPGPDGFRFSPKVTQGCEKWVDLERHDDIEACYARLHAGGFTVAAAVPGGGVALDALDVSGPIALVFGNEHAGLTEAAQAAADLRFGIPHRGFTQSLNLSVACAVSTYTTAARRRALLGREGDLDHVAARELTARFYRLSVDEHEAILARLLSDRAARP